MTSVRGSVSPAPDAPSVGQLFARAPVPMWVYDPETLRFLEVNGEAVRRYGYAREEFLAMTIADIRPREDVPRLLEDVASAREGGPRAGTWRHRLRDGSVVDVEVSSVDVEWGGRTARLVAAVDVREREEARRERARSERERAEAELIWATIFELARWGIAEFDAAGRILRVNPAFAAMHGARPEDLVGRLQLDLYAPEAREHVRAEIAEALRTGHRVFEALRARVDGSTFPALMDLTSVRDERGREVKRLVGVLDVSEQRRAWDRLAFLAETGRLLSSGDGPEETLAAVARAAVPAVADWCTVELTDPDGGRRTVAVVAADPDT
ncbi:MAG TPA: PAS domain S-box protein, partial [Actinomycetota bacterium]|nr:PAS domain S-box protein [Actinomycetota bacterium]